MMRPRVNIKPIVLDEALVKYKSNSTWLMNAQNIKSKTREFCRE